jgi:hypothetical protein
MSHYLSFLVTTEGPLQIYAAPGLCSHGDARAGWKIQGEAEGEWIGEKHDSLTVRHEDQQTARTIRALLMDRFPNRATLLESITETRGIGGMVVRYCSGAPESTPAGVWGADLYYDGSGDWAQITEVSGGLGVHEGATLTAPALTEVSGGLNVHEGATLTAPALTKTGGLNVHEGATLTAPALTEVAGWLGVREGATLTAPALTKTGWLDVHEGATLTAPALRLPRGWVRTETGIITRGP